MNRDSLGSWQKCIQVAKDALQAGQSVVVDNTNADVPTRQRYVALAKEFRVQVGGVNIAYAFYVKRKMLVILCLFPHLFPTLDSLLPLSSFHFHGAPYEQVPQNGISG